MRKPIIATAALLGALALAGPAAAATYELNLWGASAQFQLYNQSAINFLTNAPNRCAAAPAQLINGNYGITVGTNCGGATQGTGPDTIILRVSSKASYDGVLALQGQAKAEDKALASQNNNFCEPVSFGVRAAVPVNTCNSGQAGDTCDYHYRVMYNDVAGNYSCKRVHLALSDVDPVSITETSPLRSFPGSGITYPGSFVHYNPMAVPFGFFAHNDVKVSMCSGGVNDGQQCAQQSDCAGGSCGAPAHIDNISKLQAILIFSGQAWSWSDFGAGYVAGLPIKVCLRDAGSGTHSTLDYAVFRSNGRTVDPNAVLPTALGGGGNPNLFFNDGTGAEMLCVDSNAGAIGYADADQAMSMDPLWTARGKTGTPTYANTIALKYQGVVPSRRSIRNGEYDNFWSIEWVLEDPNNPDYAAETSKRTLITGGGNGLMDQVASPTRITATDRANFWASMCEMNYMKLDPATGQPSYKYYPEYVGATCAQLP